MTIIIAPSFISSQYQLVCLSLLGYPIRSDATGTLRKIIGAEPANTLPRVSTPLPHLSHLPLSRTTLTVGSRFTPLPSPPPGPTNPPFLGTAGALYRTMVLPSSQHAQNFLLTGYNITYAQFTTTHEMRKEKTNSMLPAHLYPNFVCLFA
ncbi:hypothetical protein Pcinc_013984 [Petrolisthes cinctipes]|uniref:Uncharacterized protein n=1 Tax=Petrolisthes cinctipes TaxID=88211 RepID=A0AAE1KS86_PETCI|nr:hypothetical protein Pcinc_013984 [Petrolisthes cinctipes]